MAGHYEQMWEAAKNLFESDSGRVIADIEKKNLAKDKKKVSELRDVNTDKPRLKKPAKTSWFFGMRIASDMEPACKKLDSAAGAKNQNDADKKKAYDNYEEKRKTYQKMLDTYKADKTKPYHLVPNEIKKLGNAMVDIGEEFKDAHIKGHKKNKRIRLLIELENKLSPFYKEMDAHLASLRRRNEDFPGENEELGDHCKSVDAEAKEIINDKFKPVLLALKTLASDQGIPNDIDFILRDCKRKTTKDPFNSTETVSRVRAWFTELKKDILREIGKLKDYP